MTKYKPKRPTYKKEHAEAAYRQLKSNQAAWIDRHNKRLCNMICGVGPVCADEILQCLGEVFVAHGVPDETD